MASPILPLIGVPACSVLGGESSFFKVGEKYVASVIDGAGGIPLVIPALGHVDQFDIMLAGLDGLLLTGSPSNVEPHHYAGTPARDGVERDPRRDATTLPLIRRAIERGVPILAICRGHQELNVALGGTLFQHVQELPGRIDHRSDKTKSYNDQYDIAHAIDIVAGGRLEALNGGRLTSEVNSLHEQAVDRVGAGLLVEAYAPDGTIEAMSLPAARAFTLSVQWHPEHPRALAWPLSRAMFQAFGDAARARAQARLARAAA